MEVVIDFEVRGSPAARLVMDLTGGLSLEAGGEVSLTWGGFSASHQVWFEGHMIWPFVERLMAVYETFAGEAKLSDSSGEFELKVAGTDRFHGKAEVSGGWTTIEPAEGRLAKASVRFEGFLLEPEGVAALARQLKKLLQETGISAELPAYMRQRPALSAQLRGWWAQRRRRD